jgi:ComF family protein
VADPVRHLRSAVRQAGIVGRAMLSVLVPPLCLSCECRLTAAEKWLCGICSMELAGRLEPGLRTIELEDGSKLEVRYALVYDGLVSKLITEMKYGDKPGLAGIFAPMLHLALGEWSDKDRAVIPVPMHPAKRRERGYNQSERLAIGLARGAGLAYRKDVLVKLRNTRPQAMLGEAARLGNVTGSIGLRPRSSVGNSRAVIVDDVMTTGATLRECAEVLGRIGIEERVACVIASSS